MDNVGCRRQRCLLVGWLGLVVAQFFYSLTDCSHHNRGNPWNEISQELAPAPGVHLYILSHQVIVSKGLVSVTLSKPSGLVTGIQFNGINNVLQTSSKQNNRGNCWWPGQVRGTSFKVIVQNENQVEISFTKTWNNGSGCPVNVDKRFIMLRGSSGFYSYAIFEHLKGWPDVNIGQVRIVFKLQVNKFHYMALSDKRQTLMPTPADRRHGQKLDYPEAVRLTNPTNPELKGEVDNKYQYSCNNKDNRVHGWISDEAAEGFWMITPSNEFRIGGPLRQDLTSHCGPTVLSMFVSTHYAGRGSGMKFTNGEQWKKVFGPVFVYLNSNSAKQNHQALWENAKAQMWKETASWPYSFPLSKHFPYSNQRGSVRGQLLVRDRYTGNDTIPAASAYVVSAPPGQPGSWQRENKGYQFWTQADHEGNFLIRGVRTGNYNLFAWVPGTIGDYKNDASITITPGLSFNARSDIKLKGLVYKPPRNGTTLWEIGIPDRTAAEFFVPGPDPSLVNRLYNNFDKFRQYGLWNRYTDIYPDQDLNYSVGVSNYTKDWLFAHVRRNMGDDNYQATTWQIIFQLDSLNKHGNHTLRLALASANAAELQVRVNDQAAEPPHFTTGEIGKDNAIARHGIHGLYDLYEVLISGSQLFNGRNTIFLTQARDSDPFSGIMYDYIRFEGPPGTKFGR